MKQITFKDIPEGMFETLRDVENFSNTSSLDKKLMELVRLRVSQKNGCAYCVDMHYKELVHLGASELRLSTLCVWEDTTFFSDKERAALKFADILTKLQRGPFPKTIIEHLQAYFTQSEICHLALCIAQINTWNRLMKAFHFEAGHYKVEV